MPQGKATANSDQSCDSVGSGMRLFGILRQTTQRGSGFGLPLLLPDVGYGQFINKNHFAYLMEMSLGLVLGLILGGGLKREQALIYFSRFVPALDRIGACAVRAAASLR